VGLEDRPGHPRPEARILLPTPKSIQVLLGIKVPVEGALADSRLGAGVVDGDMVSWTQN